MDNWYKKNIEHLSNMNFLKHIKRVLPFLLAFIIPLLLSITLFKANGYYPFDNNGHSLAMIDMQGQYIPFFRYYKQILNGENDVFYTLGKVMGGDMLSIFLYYLASPFNLIVAFFPSSELPAALLWIVVLKIASAGLTAYIALNSINKNGYVNLIFALAYALIAYNFIYYSNIMWLDGVLALPLVALGIKKILEKKTMLLYIFALTYVLMTSWYIGIMVCIFSVLFFLAEYFAKDGSQRKNYKIIINFTLASLVAGIASFAFWGTAIINIMGTKGASSFSNLSTAFRVFYESIKIERGFVFGGYAGMSDITGQAVAFYVGAIPMILTLLFFTNKNFTIKRKLLVGLLFAIYLLAFFNKGLDNLFHGGPAPNWFPGRYTFVFGFLLVLYGAETFKNIEKLPWTSFLLPITIYIVFLTKISNEGYDFNKDGITYFIISILFLLGVYILKLISAINEKNEKNHLRTFVKLTTPLITLMLLGVSVSSVYSNANIVLKSFDQTLSHETMEVYRQDEKLADAIAYVKNNDDGLYRLEKSFIRKGTYNNANNDALYYGYNGLSHYSSSEKQSTMNYLKKIGYHYNGFNLNYANGSTLAMNSYLGVKYLLDKGQNSNFDFVSKLTNLHYANDEGVSIYENDYALPFLFAMDSTSSEYVGEGKYLADDSIYWFDMFEYQNNIFKTLAHNVVDEFGVQKDIFKKATYTTTLTDAQALAQDYEYKTERNGAIGFEVTFDQDSNYYYYIHTKNTSNLRLYENGIPKTYFSYHGYQINGLKKRATNARLAVVVDEPKDDVYIKEAIYYEDLSVLQEYIEAIKSSADVNISQARTSKYEAVMTTNKASQMMVMTLPYDQNIKVIIDGKAVKTMTRLNIFTSFVIPTVGEHKITIEYRQQSFTLGIPLAVLTIGTTITLYIFKKRKQKEISN